MNPQEDNDVPEKDVNKKKKRPEVPLSRDAVIKRLKQRKDKSKESPLKTLKEIFEESPDKDRFIGDTMFWKYFEDIDISRIYHTTSVEFRNLKIMFSETVFYVCLLLIFTVYVYQMQSMNVFEARKEQLEYWGGCNAEGMCKLREVNDVTSFWDWMNNELIPNAFTHYEYAPKVANITTAVGNNDFSLTWSPRFVGPAMTNMLLGAIRIRGMRVTANKGCEVSKLYSHVFHECYGTFKQKFQSKKFYAPRFAPTYLRDTFSWKDAAFTQQTTISGTMNSYPGDGFTVDLPHHRSDSEEMMSDLRAWHWFDVATRAVIVELSTLNTNVNVIVNSRILFEFGPTGSVLSTQEASAAQVFFFTPSQKSGDAFSVYILQIITLVMFIWFTAWVLFLMAKTCLNFIGHSDFWHWLTRAGPTRVLSLFARTVWHYFQYGWNLVDLLIIILFYVHIGYRFSVYSMVKNEPAMQSEDIGNPEKFMPFSKVMVRLTYAFNVLSILSILCWVKLFKYLCMIGYFRLLVRILENCAKQLIVFSALLIVVFFGFAVCFFVSFGGEDENFSSLYSSFLVLFFLLIDGYSVESTWFEPGRLQLMPIVFFCYIAVVYFILLNVSMAIILDVYAGLNHFHQERSQQGKKNPMVTFIFTYYNWAKGISLVKEEYEENLRSEELSISLNLLPGIVRRKWIEKKRKMQAVANESFAGLELFPGELVAEEEHKTATGDWMLPSSKAEIMKMTSPTIRGPSPVYEVPNAMLAQEVSWSQLQRLMDEDESLPLLLGTQKAGEVIRKFKLGAGANLPPDDAHAGDMWEADDEGKRTHEADRVRAAQANVFARIDELERIPPEMEVPNVPEIKALTDEMSGAVTDVQNQFRIQLTSIIEAIGALFEHLVELTQGIDGVRQNHEAVIERVRDKQVNMGFGDSMSQTSRR